MSIRVLSGLVSRIIGEANSGSLSSSASSESYQTTVKSVSLEGAGATANEGRASVIWDLTFEARSWGIKGMDVVLQAVDVEIESEHTETGRIAPFAAKWSVGAPNGWNAQVVNPPRSFPADVYPREVAVHVAEKRIEVIF